MDLLRQTRIDVFTENQLDRYEQVFEIHMTHTVFGLGAQQSIFFLTFFTIEDFCTFRCSCFAVGVELHDVLEDLTTTGLTLYRAPRGGMF